jgi:hypothetical protein
MKIIQKTINKISNILNKNKKKEAGVLFFGEEVQLSKNNKNLFSNSDIRQHTLVFGTTGKGKSSFLNPEKIEAERIKKATKKIKNKLDNF